MADERKKTMGRPRTRSDEEQPGWNYFKFYFKTWRRKVTEMKMTAAEEGVYIHLMCVLAEQDMLPWDVQVLSTYTRFDKQMLSRWLAKWKHLLCNCPANAEYFTSAKLWNLAIKSGKVKGDFCTDETKLDKDDDETTYSAADAAGDKNVKKSKTKTPASHVSGKNVPTDEFMDYPGDKQARYADKDCTTCLGTGTYTTDKVMRGTSYRIDTRCPCTEAV